MPYFRTPNSHLAQEGLFHTPSYLMANMNQNSSSIWEYIKQNMSLKTSMLSAKAANLHPYFHIHIPKLSNGDAHKSAYVYYACMSSQLPVKHR